MKPLVVNLVVSCTNRKTSRPVVRMRDYQALPLPDRVREWSAALRRNAQRGAVAARSLYSGDHWAVARCLADDPPSGTKVRLWVSSAGYGLVSLDEELVPYSATFSTGQPDSVVGDDQEVGSVPEVVALWWKRLTERRKRSRAVPCSVAEIAAAYPKSPLLVSASPAYMRAMLPDIRAAREKLATGDFLSLFTSREARLGELADHLVPYDGRFQSMHEGDDESTFGGAYPSLNIRAASKALTTARSTGCRLGALKKTFEKLGAKQPELRDFSHRKRATPEHVAAFIRTALRRDPRASHTRLLREFRESGHAFEYTRFRAVFHDVRNRRPPESDRHH